MTAKNGYTLYGSKGSGSAAVEAALCLAEVPFRKVNASSWEAGAGREELKRVNPMVQIPTLITPTGELYTESAAVLLAIAAYHPSAQLLPRRLADQLQAIRAMTYIAANCYALIGVIDYPERYCDGVAADEDKALRERIRTRSTHRLHELWGVFAQQFVAPAHKAAFLFGDQVSAADLLAYTVSRWSGSRQHIRQHAPRLHEVFEAVRAHAKLKPVWDAHFPPH